MEIVQDKAREARHHMEIDRTLVEGGAPSPCLRLYEWTRPAITAGLFSEPAKFLVLDRCRSEIVMRPTGGGILFHQADLVCSFFFPMAQSVQEVGRFVNSRLYAALSPFLPPLVPVHASSTGPGHFCMAHPAETDLLWNGKKIGGCAFRKTRKGVLQQACLFLQVPDWSYIVSCLKNEEDLYAMQASSISIEELAGPSDKPSIQESIIQKFKGIPP